MNRQLNKSLTFAILIAVLAYVLSSKHADAQADQGTITGVIQDSTGALVGSAQVTLTNTDTGLTRKAASDSSGFTSFLL